MGLFKIQFPRTSITLSVAALLCCVSLAQASGGKAPLPDTVPTIPDLSLVTNGGTGCQGSGSIRLQSEKTALAVDFLNFAATNTTSTLARKTCALVIPVEVPAGWELSIDKLTVKGVARLSDNQSVKIRLDLFTAGTQGPFIEQQLDATHNGPFELTLDASKDTKGEAVVATACGPTSVNVRANLSATLMGSGAQIEIQSLGDTANQELLGFKWKRCSN